MQSVLRHVLRLSSAAAVALTAPACEVSRYDVQVLQSQISVRCSRLMTRALTCHKQ